MTLTDLVPTLDLCQQLKAAGFPQDTALVWVPSDALQDGSAPFVYNRDEVEMWEVGILCAAPTAEEILKELPLFLNKAINEQLCVTREENAPACNGWLVGWWSMDIHGVLGGIGEKSLSNVAAESYLWWKKGVAG